MDKKEIKVGLNIINDRYVMTFNLSEIKQLDLYDDGADQIKELFLVILKDLLDCDMQFVLSIGDSINEKDSNSLQANVAKAYIEQLNKDLAELKTNKYLLEIRKVRV